MRIQLNINMGLTGQHFNLPQLQARWNMIDMLVTGNTDWKVLRSARSDRQVEHPTADLLIMQNVYVARVDGYTPSDDQFISSLADVLGQGCIAVYNERTQTGKLIGSRTDPWGEFDNNLFVFIDEVAA
jgi:hypothetical protein